MVYYNERLDIIGLKKGIFVRIEEGQVFMVLTDEWLLL